jgi:hypothetical protein
MKFIIVLFFIIALFTNLCYYNNKKNVDTLLDKLNNIKQIIKLNNKGEKNGNRKIKTPAG